MKVQLVSKTEGLGIYKNKSIDEIIVGQARVSSRKNENTLFEKSDKLLRHCISNQHWSIFDLANLGFNIETSRAIGREILRHWSIHPTEFSQRYSSDIKFEPIELREQSLSNRQSSTNIIDLNISFNRITQDWETDNSANELVNDYLDYGKKLYNSLITNNVAKETARFILPETTTTQMYLNGTIRSWITFLNARLHKTSQKEIRLIAEQVRDIFIKECPIISECLYNFENAYEIPILDTIVLKKYEK
jgi:thymidylate synthase (FAD)